MDNSNSAVLPMEPKRSGLFSRMFSTIAQRRANPSQLVALDIGTSRIVVVVANCDEDGQLEVLGCGTTVSHGLKAGMVVNIEETVESIRRAVEEAEEMTDCTIRNVNVGIAGSHIHSINASGAIPVREGEITSPVVERVLDAASAVKLTDDKRILHVLPQEYAIDDQYGIRTPLGMSGVRLDARVHLITAGVGALHNLVKCVRHCGLTVDHVVLEQLASSESVLTPDERELGVALVDIGGGTSDIAVFYSGAIHYTATIPVAGDHVNRDIAIALSTRVQDAEQLKIEHGCAISDPAQADQILEVPGLGGRPAAQLRGSVLGDIIRPRYLELFELINDELRRSGYYDKIEGAGLVLTGGGAMVRGLDLLAEEVFNRPVRVGGPQHLRFRDERFNQPMYATGIGLLTYHDPANPGLGSSAVADSWRQRIFSWI